MADVEIDSGLVGRRVCNPARPEWGSGTVLRVQSTTVNGSPVHRVSVQFATGHRTVMVPPGRLAEPQAGPQRDAGWLDTIAGQTPDDRLAALPEAVSDFLGTSAQRLVVLARLYELSNDGPALLQWARSQSGAADPLSLWTRDQIRFAFAEYCRRRDALLRQTVASLRSSGGPAAVKDAFEQVPEGAREGMLAVVG